MSGENEGVSRRGVISGAVPMALGAVAGAAYLNSTQIAQAQDTPTSSGKLSEVLNRGYLIAGVTSTIPPFGFKDDSGKFAGFDIEIAKIIAKGLFSDPEKIEFFEQEMDSRIPNLASGKVDITVQLITVTAPRAQLVEFSIPYFREGVTTLQPSDSPYAGAKAMIGKGVTISSLQNEFNKADILKMVPDAKVDLYSSVSDALLALEGGRADAYYGGHSEIDYTMKLAPGLYKKGDTSWNPMSYSLAVRPGDQVWLNFVNTALHEAMTGVEFDAYAAAYKAAFGVDVPSPPLGPPREYFFPS
jgi:polar amino acid transport system substrate-binding protein